MHIGLKMVHRFLLIFMFIVLPLTAISPQEILESAQLLYSAVKNHNTQAAHKILKANNKLYGNKVKLLEQAREIAKKNNDTYMTQTLTEQIIEAQKSFWQCYHIPITIVGMGVSLVIGCRLGVYVERRNNNLFGGD